MRKILILSGIVAAIVYTSAVILGGILWQGYSHLAQPVSELIGTMAPNKGLLDPFFGLYNLLVIAFGVGIYQIARGRNAKSKGWGFWSAIILIAEGLFGFATLFFPQEPIGAIISPSGTMHIVLAGLSSLATMLAFLFTGIWLLRESGRRNLALYCLTTLAVVFAGGGLAAYGVANQHPLAGFFERIAIFGFIQWLVVIGWHLLPNPQKRHRHRGHAPVAA